VLSNSFLKPLISNDYHSLDEDFSDALKKYNKTRKPFEFEKLLDVIVGQLIASQLIGGKAE
jgi:hypothetical protein